ncbi:putative spindle-pole body protein (Pcp1) [Aspergillus fumigatus Af293]|uniref:Spindle-pole body protein (Pcp1), putative n=2 Tax=Aspergillus fumigatus TaxID=746128 RepID=Q4WXF9_ASPFU|nr:spindle-pole body protein (Pcp1), putative [Aspergillus fumigatus Af293]EAL92644.1 spindle-pole body protein (Pcp1), putative [Aspergillus fumigatus Af293]EDP52807.1 spindle-pole body protein (Pcp1), putative [Aspergillus fumigatus A1163]
MTSYRKTRGEMLGPTAATNTLNQIKPDVNIAQAKPRSRMLTAQNTSSIIASNASKMAYPYIDTPRTEVDGNATYLTNGYRSAGRHNLSALDSVENSFQSPSKDGDILKSLGDRRRSSGGFKLSTPRAGSGSRPIKSALKSRQHLPTVAPAKGEFTPLMQSATKNNLLRNLTTTRGAGDVKTPAYLRASYRSNVNTPGLPPMEMTGIDEEEDVTEEPTPLPQVASSSVQSTPLPSLRRDGNVLNDGQNNMTLKEQEKLKIHYLQEQLQKAGPEYNQAALKENTELKVTKLTMQRDIARYKKSLQQAERDLETYRLQFQEVKEKLRRRQIDETVQQELDLMREEMERKDNRVRELQEELREAKERQSQNLEKLRDEIEDLEAALREKDRTIEAREEEIEELKDRDNKDRDSVSELEAELQRAKEHLQDLQASLDQAKADADDARNAANKAVQEKAKADRDLRELHEEMANKSFSTKGLTRQLEERTAKLEDDLGQLQRENDSLKEQLDLKTQNERRLEEQYRNIQRDIDEEKRKLRDDATAAKRERDSTRQERDKLLSELQDALDELQRRTEEKDLLQTRHQALTDESGSLQRELSQERSQVRELQRALDEEKQRSLENGRIIRAQYKEEVERLQEEIESLQHEIEDKEGQFALEQDRWESAKRTLQLQKDRAEDQAAGYKRTIEKLEQVEHSLSGKEVKLQEVIDSEKARHFNAEAVLSRQVKELNDDIASKREVIDELRNELLSVKEELRVTKREEVALRERVQALDDEVVVLQASLEEEQEYTKARLQKGSSEDGHLQKLVAEKQKLRDQLANAHVELHDLRTSVAELEAERDELQSQLDNVKEQVGDTARFDREKIDLRKSTLRLEGEVKRLKDDKASLLEAKESLEKQLSSEIERATQEENRLSAEIDQLQDKLHVASGGRDRELTLAKGKVQRLEKRIHELELLLEQQPLGDNEQSSANADLSMLRHNLDEARKRERVLLQREADQKSSVRKCKQRISELERELHDALMNKYETSSPHGSPSDKLHEQTRSLRKQLSETHRALKELRAKNRDLERAAMREEDQRDLHELLKSSTLEAESLALQVSERDARLSDLKSQLRRVREERAFCSRKAEAATKELESLRERYDRIVKSMESHADNKNRHDKEISGLGREIIWLRARLRREEKFRRDLAWSKGLMELGERVRVACNEADLRMINEMGVKPLDRTYFRTPRQKLKAAISMILATVRMQRKSREWSKTKKLGEGLKRAKNEVLKKRRESSGKAAMT